MSDEWTKVGIALLFLGPVLAFKLRTFASLTITEATSESDLTSASVLRALSWVSGIMSIIGAGILCKSLFQ